MILLVDHHPQAIREKDSRAATQRVLTIQPRELLADQMALVEQSPRRRWKLVETIHHRFVEGRDGANGISNLRQDPKALPISRPCRERVSLDVARQSDPGR